MSYNDLISGGGLTPRREQRKYYNAITRTLAARPIDSKARVAVIEAETGVGKGMGYLWALAEAVIASNHTKQFVVSTFTRNLLHQFIDKDAAIIRKAVAALGHSISIEPWLAQNAYLSVTRINREIARLSALVPNDPAIAHSVTQMHAWLYYAQANSPALIDEALENLVLPPGITRDEICLRPDCPSVEGKDYRLARQKALNADILIVTHALACLDVMNGKQFTDVRNCSAIVFDEAGKLEDACNSVLVYREVYDPKYLTHKLAHAIRDEATALLRANSYPKQLTVTIKDPQFVPLIDLCDKAVALYASSSPRGPEIFDRLWEFTKAARDLSAVPTVKAFLSVAPVSETPALNASTIHPVNVFQRIFDGRNSQNGSQYEQVIFTGATLKPLVEEMFLDDWTPRPFPTTQLDKTLSYYENTSTGTKYNGGAIAPTSFGSQSFVFAIMNNVPDPMKDDYDPITNEKFRLPSDDYLAHVEGVIDRAHSLVGTIESPVEPGSKRSLVLVPSFHDVDKIEQFHKARNRTSKLLVHRRGALLNTILDEFRSPTNANSILISPSAWEGVDLPGMVQNLIIGRIPFEPPSDVKSLYLSNYPGVTYWHSTYRTEAKFKQGLGRSLRADNDVSVVWSADPRFPFPGAHLISGHHPSAARQYLQPQEMVAKRFLKMLGQAKIVGLNGV